MPRDRTNVLPLRPPGAEPLRSVQLTPNTARALDRIAIRAAEAGADWPPEQVVGMAIGVLELTLDQVLERCAHGPKDPRTP